jgi:hypothetical protein
MQAANGSPAGSHLQDRSATDSLGILKKQHKRNEPGESTSFRLVLIYGVQNNCSFGKDITSFHK